MQSFQHPDIFESRHIGPSKEDIKEMCSVCGVSSVDELIDETVPSNIRLKNKLKLDEPLSEYEFINLIQSVASKNKVFKSYIGMGYNPTCLLYTSPSPRDRTRSRMPSSA